MEKIKVVWICSMSNSAIRERLKFYKWTPMAILRRLKGVMPVYDLHKWNSNGIAEFEKFGDIELHIISPHNYLSHTQEFNINGVYYHFIKNEKDCLIDFIKRNIWKKIRTDYKINAKRICKIVEKINPDIVHVIGAENPEYSQAAIYISKERPLIVSLQTLLADPIFLKYRPWFKDKEAYRVETEAKVLKCADYIGTKSEHFRTIIRDGIAPDAKFFDMVLAVGEDVSISNNEKEYDFVYFAKDISKAVDYAIEAFALAVAEHPKITLHIVGGYSEGNIEPLKARIKELGIEQLVDFTGKLATHDDVINEIEKARFALLPVKADLVSGTIREAMAHGIPVVTTITPETPKLNKERESILLSEKCDFKAMAGNMCRLLTEEGLADRLQKNAAETVKERYSNDAAMKQWRKCYYDVLASKNN